ncbi:MAG: hypothetical protein R3F55_12490 [Alphaproteobacteria bacterium]
MAERESAGPGTGASAGDRDVAAQALIDVFGGIRPMAAKLGVPVSTVQGWKQRDTIPAARVPAVTAAAARHGIQLPPLQPQHVPAAIGPSVADSAAQGTLRSHRPAGPRPPMRFSPPEEMAQPAAAPAPEPGASAAEPARPDQPRPTQSQPAQPQSEQPRSEQPRSEQPRSEQRRAAAPRSEPPPEPAAPAAGRSRAALVVAVLALLVALAWPVLFAEWQGAGAQDGGLDALAQRIEALEQANGGADAGAVAGLRADLDALRASGVSDVVEAVHALGARVDALEGAAATAPAGDGSTVPAAVTQALDSLQQAIDGLDRATSGLADRLAAIETKVSTLEQGAGGADVDALKASVADLESALAQIRGDLQGVADGARAAGADVLAQATALIDQRTAALDTRIAALAGRDELAAGRQAFLIALGQFGARLRTAAPYADELAALQQLAGDSDAISPDLAAAVRDQLAPLEAHAAQGVPTLAGLQVAFDETRRAVLTAPGDAPDDTLDEIVDELGGLVVVSRVDETGADSVDGLLAAAERHLTAGDLAGAVASMRGLEALGSGYADAAAGWLAQAEQRLAADRALDAVNRAAMASFQGDGAAAPAPAPDGGGESAPAPAPAE